MTTTTADTAACALCGAETQSRLRPKQVFGPDGAVRDANGWRAGTCDDCWTLRPDEEGSAVRAALRLIGRPEGDDALAAQVFADAGLDVGRLLFGEYRPPQGKPWRHVDRESLRALKAAYVQVLDARVHAASDAADRPAPPGRSSWPPPDEDALRGCAYCGVATAPEWARVVSNALSRVRTRSLSGVLCPACAEAHVAVGAVGPRAWTLAFCEARGLVYQDDARMRGLRPFALADAEPSGEPWAFVGDDVGYPEPPPTLDEQVAALAARVADLEARLP